MANKGTITRRMDAVLTGLQFDFRALCDIRDFESKLKALQEAGNQSDRGSKLRALFDMFDLCGIPYEKGQDNAYYENLIRTSEIPTSSEIEDRMLDALYKRFREYPTPEQFMTRLVDRLSFPEDHWENDTLRLRILKQFMKYGNYLTAAEIGGKTAISCYVKEKSGLEKPSAEQMLQLVDDGVFQVLDRSKTNAAAPDEKQAPAEQKQTKNQKKDAKRKVELLRIADDLASGKFRTEGSTRKTLYWFAIVYKMTYYSGEGDYVDARDMEEKLFRDYYTNNLMRFVTDAYRGKSGEFEIDPSGQGINYKNYSEVVYLYYLCSDYAPQEKIKRACKMIARIQKSQLKQGRPETSKQFGTKHYRSYLKGDDIADVPSEEVLRLSEDDFEAFLCNHYNCDTYDGQYKTKTGMKDKIMSPIRLESEQNSAFLEYNKLVKQLKSMGYDLKDCSYGLWFADVDAFRMKGYQNICDRNPEIDRDEFGRFMELLFSINSFMRGKGGGKARGKQTALSVSSAKEITRTSLIVAFYYYYNALHENDSISEWKRFEEVFRNYETALNPVLDSANYQRLSGKNIFDVLVVFSSYAYLNI